MPEEVAYECPACGANVKEEDTKCDSCGAEFASDAGDEPASQGAPDEDDAKQRDGPADAGPPEVVEAEPAEPEGPGPDGGKASEEEGEAGEAGEGGDGSDEAEEPADGDDGDDESSGVKGGEEEATGGKDGEEDDGKDEPEEGGPGAEKVAGKPGAEKAAQPPKAGKPGPNLVGIAVAVLGALGLGGAILLDPLLNLIDNNHPAEPSIGTSQLAIMIAAAPVMMAGIIIAFTLRRTEDRRPTAGQRANRR
jgi:hypothetical protein